MAKTRRKYKGNATTTTIGAGLAAGATSATIAANTGWPTTAPFYCVVSPGTSSEEKILVGAISGTSISSITRGVDDTSDQTHASGCTIYPVFTAIDADEANELTSTYSAQGHIVYQGASTFTGLAIGTAGQVLKVNSGATAPEWGQVPTAGIADDAVTAAKIATDAVGSAEIAANAVTATEIASDAVTTAKILDGAVTSAKILDGTIVDGDINASAAIALSKLATGALPTAITVASANIVNGTIVAEDLASDSVTTTKIAVGAGAIKVYASTAARDSAITSPTAGMVVYIDSGDANEGLYTYNGSSWYKGAGWNMPWGIIAGASPITSDSATVTTTAPSIYSVSFTAVANRRYKITTDFTFSYTDFSDVWNLELADGSNVPVYALLKNGVATGRLNGVYIYSPTTDSSVTFNIRLAATGTPSGSAKTTASSTNPNWFFVEDIGAA